MNDWRDPHRFGDDIFDAELYNASARRHRKAMPWAAGAIVLLVAVAGGLAWYFQTEAKTRNVAALFPDDGSESLQAAAYSAYTTGDAKSAFELVKELRPLFHAIETAACDEDNQAFLAHVDFDVFVHRAIASAPRAASFEARSGIKREVRDGLSVDTLWQRIRVVHVDAFGDGKAAIAYSYCGNDAGENVQVCWWLVRHDSSWKVCDWKRLDMGLAESQEWGVYAAHWDDPHLQSYFTARELMSGAYQQSMEGELGQAVMKLKRAQAQSVPRPLADETDLMLGYHWRQFGRTSEAAEAFRRIADPDATPGAFLGLGFCYDDYGDSGQALQFAEQYEDLVGYDSDNNRTKADALLRLGRLREAASEWEKVLFASPDDSDALAELARLLAPDEQDRLLAVLEKTLDPPTAALDLAREMANRGNPNAVAEVGRLLEQLGGDEASVIYVQGLMCRAAGDKLGTAEKFLEAADRERDQLKRESYANDHLVAMGVAGRIAEGYRRAADPVAAFHYLAEDYDYGESVLTAVQMDELLLLHRENCPDDAWLYYFAGIRFREQEQYDQALEQLDICLEKTNEDWLIEQCEYEKQITQIKAGRVLDAYGQLESPQEEFESLADYCVWNDCLDGLQQLVSAHRESHPQDPWLNYYQAIVLDDQNKLTEAEQLLTDGLAGTEEERIRQAYEARLSVLRLEAGDGLRAYGDAENPESVFENVAATFQREEKWEALKTTIQLHKQSGADESSWLHWEADLLWATEDYASLVERFGQWREFRDAVNDNWRLNALFENLVRAFIRLGQIQDAERVAQELYDEQTESLPGLLAAAAKRDPQQALKFMERYAQSEYLVNSLYSDKDIGDILWSEPFLPVRERFPPNPTWADSDALVLLLDKPVEPSEDLLRKKLDAIPGSLSSLARLGSDNQSPIDNFVLSSDEMQTCLAFGRRPYPSEASIAESAMVKQPLKRALEDHQAFLAIAGSATTSVNGEAVERAMRQVAAALADDNCLALYFENDSRLVAYGPELDQLLAGTAKLAAEPDWGEEAWLVYDAPQDRDPTSEDAHRKRKLFSEFQQCVASDGVPATSIKVQVRCRVGLAEEAIWLDVVSIRPATYYGWNIIGRLQSDSRINPRFRSGGFARVSSRDVIDWKTGDEE